MKEIKPIIKKQIEALIFVADKPLYPQEIAKILEITVEEVEYILQELKKEYEERGINLYKINGAYEFATSPDTASALWRYVSRKRERLSKAALEALAIIYYHQPITKAEIETIRGAKVDSVLGMLLEKRLVKIVGRKETIGRPFLYGIGDEFYRYFFIEDDEELRR
ncbi:MULTISPECIES: SMC-Scp complex subunit ScpB [Dictyoglomus]|jgi:segregation and condensation protein B|uniref:Chromosome segregation and condensation protein, ScpB n=1 Tax=Dictyoglomus turgidum (strain DSM 6724 / Z-1310) TaxID=515635 RepID=B8E104_DICTD|nr:MULTISPECIES: SMC-Scp complex subunit ScpB [Dictyoglomus]ACK42741.1 chromosome segregation and condensation protein, ScpB [Dictyoglomus turgidum DSM 6724]HBU30800.1 SMC-Scp complex subunit ScpB [Dictyoglomus sp.]